MEGHLDMEVTIEAVDKRARESHAGPVCGEHASRLRNAPQRPASAGRYPHVTQRLCGVCPTSHGMAAVLALEAAYGPPAAPPANGRILRNLILGADFLQSHILHFYQLALLDYVDTSEVFKHAPGHPAFRGRTWSPERRPTNCWGTMWPRGTFAGKHIS